MTEAQFRVFTVAWVGGLLASHVTWKDGFGIIAVVVLAYFVSKLAGWVAAGAKVEKE